MSSLRRFPSLECAEYAAPQLSSNARQLARLSSLPALSLCRPRGLPSLPSPCKPHQRSCSRSVPFCSPSCGHKQDGTRRTLTSFRSVPVWSADYEGDCMSEYCMSAVTHSVTRKECFHMEDSIVYKELCESIRLQIPGGNACMLSLEGAIQSAVGDAGRSCGRSCEVEEKALDLSSSDVKGRPMSLRMLKRRVSSKSEVSPSCLLNKQQVDGGWNSCLVENSSVGGSDSLLSDATGSVNSAFASLVFIMESLQQHTLRLRRVLMSEADARLQVVMEKVHQEMQDTFIWLFQKVFACTPKLMLLTMMLLADFAAHSMGEHVALAVMPMGEPPTMSIESSIAVSPTLLYLQVAEATVDGSRISYGVPHASCSHLMQGSSEPCFCEGGAGNGVVRVVKVGGDTDGEAASNTYVDRAAMTTHDDAHGGLTDACDGGYLAILSEKDMLMSDTGSSSGGNVNKEHQMLHTMWEQVVSKERIPKPLTNTRHILVAPVRAPALEADDYACYDRTDLKYQHELSRDPSNPLLLANYAQFLHVVRHDHDRAEELYKRAVKADPVDGELMGKYASFLWVAKENAEGADEAYKAALMVDPSNAYHAGSYAHFLWNSGAEQDDMSTPSTACLQVPTS